jgi:hypothetical protein
MLIESFSPSNAVDAAFIADWLFLAGGPAIQPGLSIFIFRSHPRSCRERKLCSKRVRGPNVPRTDGNHFTDFGKITSVRDGQNDQREIQFALKAYY